MGKMEDKVCMVCIPMGRNNGKNCQCWGEDVEETRLSHYFPTVPSEYNPLYTNTLAAHSCSLVFHRIRNVKKGSLEREREREPPNSASAAFVQDAPKLSVSP